MVELRYRRTGRIPATGRNPVRIEGNSFSLSRDCVGGGQHAADTAAAREPCMDETHVVGKFSRPKDYYSYALP